MGRRKEGTTMKIIINAKRTGYGTDQIARTLTVGDLIEALSQYEEDTPVYIGNDPTSYGWYTYGGIDWSDVCEQDEGEEEEQ